MSDMTMDDYSPAKLQLHSYEYSLRGLLVPMLLILSGYGTNIKTKTSH